MKLIENTKELKSFCLKIKKQPYIAVDTEFKREKTYFPHLCLIQIKGGEHEAAIDPLAEGIDLEPLKKILADKKIRKVLHGCRQDLEIFLTEFKELPKNIFDTQVAAMVCGFGDSSSYATLVYHYIKKDVDKTQRFTDWAIRPLSEKQITYAMDDVIFLHEIYPMLLHDIESKGRLSWVEEDMDELNKPENFYTKPEEAWEKIKTKFNKPKFLAVLKEVAAWREIRAQEKNIPRNRVMRDESLVEISTSQPKDKHELVKIRGVGDGILKSASCDTLMAAIRRGIEMKNSDHPVKDKKETYPSHIAPSVELLKVLLKMKSDESGVATRLISSNEDLYELAFQEKPDVPALHGWRYEIFGQDALRLKSGEIGFSLSPKGKIKIVKTCE